MAARKPISVNLRDLQRVLNEGKPEMPRFSGGAEGEKDDDQANAFGEGRYRSSKSRWANENDDDEFDARGGREAREEKPEPDFSTVRSTNNEFSRLDTGVSSGGRSAPADDFERKPDDDVWRCANVQATKDEPEEDDVWRRPSGGNVSRSSRQDQASNKREEESKDGDSDNMFSRSATQRESGGKKLYVPPSKKFDSVGVSSGPSEAASGGTSSRFSCLDDGYERAPSQSNNFESSRAREVFSMQRRDQEGSREYGSHNGREAFRDLNKENSRTSYFGEQQKSGVYVPSYRRSQTHGSTVTSKNSSVHDIFLKAAGITESKAPEERRKVVKTEPQKEAPAQPQPDPQIQQKREAILRHNRMYEANTDTLKKVETAVNTLIGGGEADVQVVVPENEEELVPAVVACLVAAKACEKCSTMQAVQDIFYRVAPLVIELCGRREESIEGKLLTEVSKFICQWKLPAIADSVYLIEAVFDALLHCKVVTRKGVLQWLDNLPDDVPDRINVILQVGWVARLHDWLAPKQRPLGRSMDGPTLRSLI
ncbi:eIF4-gamma eIF5 eIF2b-epsilon carboxy-terminal domain-containing protein, putative [Babesia caballi]|uniref:EIF4-gamma eIF5 eIF2b-epsilon carboxy-terminal domain-containing protein, putative n=1 Tax=Babesia caballi TaxID=5871 RepID=A0AAV4LQE1_BABCB|nr:eIF4-gamma eIF5 eIF2b-epsilon carboxy-terminal domain-containing protein, putative [Babesia caballi]